MRRPYCLCVYIALACVVPVQAQPKTAPEPFTNGIGMKFVWIPPGEFMMGSSMEEKERRNDEVQHKVKLTKGFYLGVHAVTQEQWKAVMGKNPSRFRGEKNLPVETVTWDDCQEFIKTLKEKEPKARKAYRLPTEAEWEYACRAGTTTPFHFGQTISTAQANYNGNYAYADGKKGNYLEKSTPVASYPANAWGLYDMHGNVMQWCQDWHGDYPKGPVVDPRGPDKGQYRVLRGGLWCDNPKYFRAASRYGLEPDRLIGNFGLRVCFSEE